MIFAGVPRGRVPSIVSKSASESNQEGWSERSRRESSISGGDQVGALRRGEQIP